jgi:hypothetical protein
MHLEQESVVANDNPYAQGLSCTQTKLGCYRDVLVVLDRPRLAFYYEDVKLLQELKICLDLNVPLSELLTHSTLN